MEISVVESADDAVMVSRTSLSRHGGRERRFVRSNAHAWTANMSRRSQSHPLDHVARKLWEEGNREEAIASWRRAVAADPGAPELLVNLAWALGQQQRTGEALALAGRAVALAPNEEYVRHTLGQVYYHAGQFEEALTQYQAALRLRRDEALLYCDLADALYSLERYEEAAVNYQMALSFGGEDPYPRLWLGWARWQIGDNEGAEAEFARTVEVQPDSPAALHALGQARCAQHKFESARDLLEQALSLYPQDEEEERSSALCELGNAHRGLGQPEEAAERYRQALTLDPTHDDARFNLGLVYADLDDWERALSTFDIALQLQPEDVDALVERGTVLAALGRHDEALGAYESALVIDPNRPDALLGMGRAYYSLSLHDHAVEFCRRAVAAIPEDGWAWYGLAVSLEAAREGEESRGCMERALELSKGDDQLCVHISRWEISQGRDPELAVRAASTACLLAPDDADAYDALAAALYFAGRFEEAVAPARRATDLASDVPDHWFGLGMILEALDHRPEARRAYRRALELAPEFEEAQEALRRLEDVL